MRKAVLFIAISLDGYIADAKGKIDWLSIAEGDKYGYEAFERSVDTTIMAGRTYRDVLGFGMPVYPDKTNYILTHKKRKNEPENYIFFSGKVTELIKKLKRRKGKDIFVVGGTAINFPLIEANMIDEYRIFTLPIILGSGIPLFGPMKKRLQLNLMKIRKYPSGMVECQYSSRKA
jgi:dihydrofolate reductase